MINTIVKLAALIFCLIIAVPSATAAAGAQIAEPVNGDLLVVRKGVNLRKGASLDSEIIRQSIKNEVVMREGTNNVNGYIRVRMKDGKPAWVFAKYTKNIIE